MKFSYHLKFALLSLFMYVSAAAQPAINKQKVIGGSDDDTFRSMYFTKDGGLIIGGSSYSNISGNKTENNRCNCSNSYIYDYWILKINKEGNIEWDKTIGGSGNDGLAALQQTADGGYILGGKSASNISGEKTENSKGSDDYWVVKLDSTGNVEWDKTIGGSNEDVLLSVQQTKSGGYILGGYSSSNISGDKTESNRGSGFYAYDYWIVELDAKGQVKWDKTIGGMGTDRLQSLKQTRDGGFIAAGSSDSNISGEKTENARGFDDYWVVKLDKLGNIEWNKTIGGSSFESMDALELSKDGGYFLGGTSYSDISGEKTENSKGQYDYWLVKLAENGNIVWDKTIGGSGGDEFGCLDETSDGVILGGSSYSNISGDKTENIKGDPFRADYWVVKLDAGRNVQWDKTIGTQFGDWLYSVKELKDNKYLLGGTTQTLKISGDKTQRGKGGTDFWLVSLDYTPQNTLSVSTLAATQLTVNLKVNKLTYNVFPNPVQHTLNIQTAIPSTITIVDQNGKVLIRKKVMNNSTIDISHLPEGMYYVKNNTIAEVKKIIVIK